MDASPAQIQQQVPLKSYSTFKIGGPAAYLIEAFSLDDLLFALHFAREHSISYLIIGKGSNTLFDDLGYEGLVIINKLSFKHQEDHIWSVGAGYSFALLGIQTARSGYKGLEFACGIPATVGGAIYMNAGAGGMETKDFLLSVTYLRDDGVIQEYSKESLQFSYRYSSFQEMKGFIISARFALEVDSSAKKRQEDILQYRLKTQPYEVPSIGCCFKNPSPELPAGKMIENLQLKGYKVGGAMVSPRHGNFIVNDKGASARDVLTLVEIIEDKVKKEYGIELHREIRVVPYAPK